MGNTQKLFARSILTTDNCGNTCVYVCVFVEVVYSARGERAFWGWYPAVAQSESTGSNGRLERERVPMGYLRKSTYTYSDTYQTETIHHISHAVIAFSVSLGHDRR